MLDKKIVLERASAALKNLFVADSLAMPAHWFYRTSDILQAFPGGIVSFEDAPSHHPSSIMSLHSTSQGGRKKPGKNTQQQIIGDVILKGKRCFWDKPNIHYHHQMKAGENTLNAHCARVLIRTLIENGGHYDSTFFLNNYIKFMTSDTPEHNDTYAESYHRGFFNNLVNGKPAHQCGAKTHDTASIGGLVTIAPIVLTERLKGTALDDVQSLCKEHLYLTHPDNKLALICFHYVNLIDRLLFRKASTSVAEILNSISCSSAGLNLEKLDSTVKDDSEVIGNRYSSACYIEHSWPATLYLAYHYRENAKQALIANTNLGGDNVHRGCLLGVIFGLISGKTIESLYTELVDHKQITQEILDLFNPAEDVLVQQTQD
jgi:ADP-ribosylglycohydrolase